MCSAKRVAGGDNASEPYSLLEFRDLAAGFISDKSLGGRDLRAQELPGYEFCRRAVFVGFSIFFFSKLLFVSFKINSQLF